MQHFQHNFKVNYWFNIKLCEDIQISKRIYQKTNLQTKFIVKCPASGPKECVYFGVIHFFWKLKNEKWNSVFDHSSFYFSFSFSWEKNNVIFLHCNRNTRPNKIEADDSNCTVIYCIFISGLVSFPLWVQKKNENWPQIFIFLFSEKKKNFWNRFSLFIFLCSEKIKIGHRFSFVICHFSISIKIKIEHRFSFFIFQCLEKNKNCKINCRFLFFIFRFKKKIKIEHRFSFFVVQLAKKMNEPNIHALIFIFLGIKELKMKKWRSILFCFQT